MTEFVYYEIDADAFTPALRKRLFAIPELRMRQAPKGDGWIVRSAAPVPRFDARVVKEERWAASVRHKPRRRPAQGAPASLISCAWKIAAGPRKAQLARRRLVPKRTALQLTFGEGTGDAVSIDVETTLSNGMTRLKIALRTPTDITLSVQPNLQARRGRLIAALEAQSWSGAGSATLEWTLPELPKGERARVEALSLTLSTEADSARVFLDAIAFDA